MNESICRASFNIGIACMFCGSSKIIKYVKANNKQVYFCKSCARKFVPNEGFEGMKYDPRVAATTLDLYFKDVSLRKIAGHLKQCYSLDIDHSTVYRWITKYTDIIGAYVATLEPELGRTPAEAAGIGIGDGNKWKTLI